MGQKSTKNQSNMDQTSIKNRAKMGYPIGPWRPKQGYSISPGGTGSYGALSGRLGSLLGRLGTVLGPSWGRPGAVSWVRLVVSWGLLESILEHLGVSWDRLAASSKRLATSWDASSGDMGSKKNDPISDSIFGSIYC